jgi:putative ABC transport system substrate-binding protein
VSRREFIALVGSAAATWPLAARAQQRSIPVIGFLEPTTSDAFASRLRSFYRGLKDLDYVVGDNVTMEERWAEGQFARLPALATDLASRGVAVIVASGGPAVARAAKEATTSIPVVFITGEDPVKLGLVASIARPGGNLTGINLFSSELTAKRLELLHQLVPAATRIAALVNPTNITNTETTLRDLEIAARDVGLQIRVLNASTSAEIDTAFSVIAAEKPDALFVGSEPFFSNRRVQLVQLAARYTIPTIYGQGDFPDYGGLISYGPDISEAWRQVGVYTGRVLKGAKPSDLPVVQATRFELIINHQTARMLGLTVAPNLLSIADEVIE